jgi:hypothetical protein
MLDPDDNPERPDFTCPRPYASHSRSRRLRSVARSGDEGCDCGVSELLKPYNSALMRCYPVSTRINHVANDDEECSAPLELTQIQNRFFS